MPEEAERFAAFTQTDLAAALKTLYTLTTHASVAAIDRTVDSLHDELISTPKDCRTTVRAAYLEAVMLRELKDALS